MAKESGETKLRPIKASPFVRCVEVAEPVNPPLPLVHTTYSALLKELVDSRELTPQPCPVFKGEYLVYYFYGKPAYRILSDLDSAMPAEAPVAIMFSPTVAERATRIYPFDTGGFERYRRFMPRHYRLDTYELPPKARIPGQVVGSIFKSNEAYINGSTDPELHVEADEFELVSLLELLRYKGKDAVDDRAWTIELQVSTSVSLTEGNVLAVILPHVLLDTRLGRTIANEWGAQLIPYAFSGRGKPAEYHSTIRELAFDYLRKNGFV